MDRTILYYCHKCKHKPECNVNNWVLTYDIDGVACDNFVFRNENRERDELYHIITSEYMYSDYEVGDTVTISDHPVSGLNIGFASGIREHLGESMTIDRIQDNITSSGEKVYRLVEDNSGWNWTAAMFSMNKLKDAEFDIASNDELQKLLRGE